MFDWEDQELANIIWGEADDQIVTYPEESDKKSQPVHEDHNKNEANEPENSKPSEQKPAATKTKMQAGELESNEELSLLASNSDVYSIGKNADPETGPENSENQTEDGELGDIIDNSWVNIESFDDLDQIFSNDEMVDHTSLDSTDEFWASSRDVLDNAVKSSSLGLDSTSWGLEALGNSSGQFGFNSDYMHSGNQSYGSAYDREADTACYTQQILQTGFDQEATDVVDEPKLVSEKTTAVCITGKTVSEPQIAARKSASTNKLSNKGNWFRSQSRHELKSDKINDHRRVRHAYSTWVPPAINVQQLDAKPVPDTTKNYMPSVLDPQKMPQQSTCLAYQQFPNPYFATYSHGNLSDQCTAMSVLPAADDGHHPVLRNAESCHRDKVFTGKSTNAPIKPQNMTPQEKIEKLRRRQQMRAMLAIQKQQQQLTHPVPVTSSQEDQIIQLERADFKCEEKILPTYDPDSPVKQDDSSSISVEVDNHNVEDTVLYQLQDTVTKLDMNIRLCIRDSLFRLAQSAMQRQHTSDSSSGNRSVGCESNIFKEDIRNQESFTSLPSAETETNYIDRAVAHLLFHQPIKSSVKHIGTSESSISPKMPPDVEIGTSSSLPLSLVTKSSANEQCISPRGLTTPHSVEASKQEDLSEQPDTDMEMNQKMKQKMVESED